MKNRILKIKHNGIINDDEHPFEYHQEKSTLPFGLTHKLFGWSTLRLLKTESLASGEGQIEREIESK